MFTEIIEALKGEALILFFGMVGGAYTGGLIIASMRVQSWIPLAVGVPAFLAPVIRFYLKHDQKLIEAESKSFIITPELQAQRFEDYIKSLPKDDKE